MCTGTHPFIPVPDTVRVRMLYTSLGEECMNVYHVKVGAEIDEPLLINIAGIFDEWHDDAVQSGQSTACTLNAIEVTDITVEGGLQYTFTAGLPRVGTGGGSPLANNVTAATKLGSVFSGRSNRGRSYWIGLTTSLVSGNELTTVMQGFIQNAYSILLAALSSAEDGLQLAVVSYCTNGAWRTTGVATPIVSTSTNIKLDSQRRRLAGRGA